MWSTAMVMWSTMSAASTLQRNQREYLPTFTECNFSTNIWETLSFGGLGMGSTEKFIAYCRGSRKSHECWRTMPSFSFVKFIGLNGPNLCIHDQRIYGIFLHAAVRDAVKLEWSWTLSLSYINRSTSPAVPQSTRKPWQASSGAVSEVALFLYF